MKAIRTLLFGLGISVFAAACTGNKSQGKQDSSAKSDFEIKQGKPLSAKDWTFYDVEQQSLCIPATWVPVKQHQFLFLVDLNKISHGGYLIVLKRPKTEKFNAHIGLKEAYEALKKDSTGIMTGDNVLQMYYQDKQTYSGEIHTAGTNMSYTNYITVFDKDGEVFEIAMKIDDGKAAQYKDIYKNIVFNFYSNGKLVFTAADKISKVEKVNLDDL